MSVLNAILRPLFDALLWPFRGLSPWWGLAVVSLATAVVALWVVKRTSNQGEIAAVKKRIQACLFEMRLFNDDFRAILRAQGEILRHNARYFLLSLAPLAWMIVPLFLVFAQLQFHYGYRGLEPGEPVLLRVELEESVEARPEASLEVPDGVRVEAGPAWLPSEGEVVWRIAAERRGEFELTVRLAGETFTKSVCSSEVVVRRSPLRPKAFFDQLFYPAEAPLPEGPVAAIHLDYPEAGVSLLGWELPWWLAYLVLVLVFAFALRKRLGVEI